MHLTKHVGDLSLPSVCTIREEPKGKSGHYLQVLRTYLPSDKSGMGLLAEIQRTGLHIIRLEEVTVPRIYKPAL